MSLEQTLAENTAALREHTAAIRELLKHHTGTAATTVTVVAGKKEKADPKPEAAPASEPTPTASASSASSSTESTQTGAAGGVEYVQIQKLVPQIAKTPEGTEKVVALFGRYGVKRGPELKPEQYDDFYADLVRVEAGELDPRTAEV